MVLSGAQVEGSKARRSVQFRFFDHRPKIVSAATTEEESDGEAFMN
jgi:hypothetical protein